MKYNLAVIEDEQESRELLTGMIKNFFPNQFDIFEAGSVDEGVNLFHNHIIHLALLDIHLSGGTGFDLLDKIDTSQTEIIFATAFSKYAVRAFQMLSIGYVLKPVDEAELVKNINRALEIIRLRKNNPESSDKYSLLNTLVASKDSKLIIPDLTGFSVINTDQIIRIEADRNYSVFYIAGSGKIVSSHNLGWFERMLDKRLFFRAAKSHIINLNHIVKYARTDGGKIILSDLSEVPISNSKKEEFKGFFRFDE